ncbi:MAG: YlmC/YmxH family sporulation protein [Clostridia bacterium]|nr:YlmC/YmxH family sporulation protein [Clostridia bacterium]
MILSFKELKKREVVNIADGRSFGKITDLQLDFPRATLKGIVVCDRKRSGLFCFWRKNEIFIDEKQIVRIGGDVILVNIKHCESIAPAVVDINAKSENGSGEKKSPPQGFPCPPPAPICPPVPPCQPICPPDFPPNGQDQRIDFEDY